MTANYFDLFDLLRNQLFGDTNMFIIGGFIIIWYIGIKFKMPYEINLLLAGLWAAIVFSETGNMTLWVILSLAAPFAFYYALKDAIQIGK